MKSTTQDLQILEDIFEQFYPVGATSLGGVTRLGYSPEEDEMHAIFRQIAEETGSHFLDANECGAEFNTIDFMHLTRRGHAALAGTLGRLIPTLL